jgi:phosphate transport system permease protein
MATLGYPALPEAGVITARDVKRKSRGLLYQAWLAFCAALAVGLALLVIGTVLFKGAPAIDWQFLSQEPTEGMSGGGIWPMIRGSILLMVGTLVIVLPLGILGGICMAEYTGRGWFSNLLRSCVTSLAGTPSIVYGLFGLAIFVLLFKFGISLLAGWFTLALFALPVIVLATETAIKQVPESMVEGGLAMGLSRWQVIRKIILPNAMPGIATGIVLSTGRAAGEAPPILLTAGIYYSTAKLTFGWETLKQPVANLPYHLAEGYRQGGVIPEKIIWGTCLTLLLLVLLINLGAILVRARVRSRQRA